MQFFVGISHQIATFRLLVIGAVRQFANPFHDFMGQWHEALLVVLATEADQAGMHHLEGVGRIADDTVRIFKPPVIGGPHGGTIFKAGRVFGHHLFKAIGNVSIRALFVGFKCLWITSEF